LTKRFSNTSIDFKGAILFWTLIIIGLIVRIIMLSYEGIFDMATYQEWGINSLHKGLAAAYQGIYYPFQYQIFEFGSWIAEFSGAKYYIIYKLINLFFDAGNMVILYLILKQFRISKYYLFIYWLHPWFLLMFSQGYCDFQFTFFILCALYLAMNPEPRRLLASGLFLGLALHMKPQVNVIVLALFIYGCIIYIRNRDIRLLNIFVFPAIIFLNYSLYFWITRGDFNLLKREFTQLPAEMSLTSNFLNIWYPVAYYLKNPGDPIYNVFDFLSINQISIRTIALMLLFTILVPFILKFKDRFARSGTVESIYLIACFATLLFPHVMTSAHENHLFLGTVLIIPVLGRIRSIPASIAIHLLIILQCLNLYGLYGYGSTSIFKIPALPYNYEIAVLFSVLAVISLTVILIYFFSSELKLNRNG
jgi:hypothetical protein